MKSLCKLRLFPATSLQYLPRTKGRDEGQPFMILLFGRHSAENDGRLIIGNDAGLYFSEFVAGMFVCIMYCINNHLIFDSFIHNYKWKFFKLYIPQYF